MPRCRFEKCVEGGELIHAYVRLVSLRWSTARAFRRDNSIPVVIGCAPPITRRAVRSVSSSVVTAAQRSSNVAAGSFTDKNSLLIARPRRGARDAAAVMAGTSSIAIGVTFARAGVRQLIFSCAGPRAPGDVPRRVLMNPVRARHSVSGSHSAHRRPSSSRASSPAPPGRC